MSATTTVELFKILAPDAAALTGGDDTVIECFLEQAALRLCASAFGQLFEQAVIYLAAHMLLFSPPGGSGMVDGGGAVTSKKTGDEAISFGAAAAASATTDLSLQKSQYGLEFIAIRDSRSARAPTFIGVV
jgi:hypothetical protein